MANGCVRLACYAFKIDVYISLLYGQPPLLRRQELDISLLSTYSIWNCYGLNIHFDRARSEPWNRGSYMVNHLDIRKASDVPSGILPDDVQICLLGLWSEIWSLENCPEVDSESHASGKRSVSQQIYLSLEQLEHMRIELGRPFVAGTYTAALLASYMGGETSESPNWAASVCDRLGALISSSTSLAHLLLMHTHADIPKLKGACTSPVPIQMEQTAESQAWQVKMLSLQAWAASADGRAATVAALQTWATYELVVVTAEQPIPLDPIVYMALSVATTVLWAWTMMDLGDCICGTLPQTEAVNIETYTSPEAQSWILTGGPILFRNRAVCKCNISARLVTWAEALDKATTSWEVAADDTSRFRAIWLER